MSDVPAARCKRSARFVDIARAAGVGLATVNRVLNDHGGVSQATREKVLQAAKSLAVPRLLPDARRGLTRIDVVLADSGTPFFRRLHLALDRLLPLLDPRVVVMRHTARSDDELRTAAFLRKPPYRRDGLIVALHDRAPIREALQQVVAEGVPVVSLMSDIGDVDDLSYAGVDNLQAGRTAGLLLGRWAARAQGRVLVLTNDLIFKAHRDRIGGFMAVLRERFPGLVLDGPWACQDEPDAAAHHTWRALLEGGQCDDASAQLVGIYHSGGGTQGVAQSLQAWQRRVPTALRPVWVGHELSDEHRAWLTEGWMDWVIDQNPDGQVRSAMSHLLHATGWIERSPGSVRNEFRLFSAENLPGGAYFDEPDNRDTTS